MPDFTCNVIKCLNSLNIILLTDFSEEWPCNDWPPTGGELQPAPTGGDLVLRMSLDRLPAGTNGLTASRIQDSYDVHFKPPAAVFCRMGIWKISTANRRGLSQAPTGGHL